MKIALSLPKRGTITLSAKTKKIVVNISTFSLAALFLYAAISKLIDYQASLLQIEMSPILKNYAHTIAWLFPSLEILIAGLLIYPRTRRIGLYSSLWLMLALTTYVVVILNYASYVPCACGGVINKLGWNGHLWLNAFFSLLALAGYALHTPGTKHRPQSK